ncbi:MAG: prephenate/arogenate dehydrogenase [Cyanobacteria bacterium]|nr:prephenate/arogenate dehydrogenase [Cyanobacteriota bacterium]
MRIGIVGLGGIGGSLAADWRDRGHHILGVSRRAETVDRAIAMGLVDGASVDPAILRSAQVVVLCPPIGQMASVAAQVVPHLAAGTVLTDAGSVKGEIVRAIAPLWPEFLGGHPMAGTEKSGLEAVQRNLFVGRPYVLTPTAQTPPEAIATLKTLIADLGAVAIDCDPDGHDRAVAWISHLPVFVSAALIDACLTEGDPAIAALAQRLASSGFRDTSRVGGGNPELGLMMARHNRAALLNGLQKYQEAIAGLMGAIAADDWDTVHSTLERTQSARPKFVDPPEGQPPQRIS